MNENNNQNYSLIEKITRVYKIIFIGNIGVGKKTTIKGLYNLYNENNNQTFKQITTDNSQFIDFTTIHVSESKVFQIWNLSFSNEITDIFDYSTIFSNSCLIILMFALNDNNSFENLIDQNGNLKIIQNTDRNKDIPIILLGNKKDQQLTNNESKIKRVINNYSQVRFYLPFSAKNKDGIILLNNSIIKYLKEEMAVTSLKLIKKLLYNLDYLQLESKQNNKFIDLNLQYRDGNLGFELKNDSENNPYT